MEGIPLKPLFSVEDRILRKFMAAQKETDVIRVVAEIMASMGKDADSVREKVTQYVDSRFFLAGKKTETGGDIEQKMIDEYEQIKNLRPEVKMNKDNHAVVSLGSYNGQ